MSPSAPACGTSTPAAVSRSWSTRKAIRITPSNARSLRWPNPNSASSSSEKGPRVGMLLVLTVVVEQVAELLGIDAEQVDPRYEDDDD